MTDVFDGPTPAGGVRAVIYYIGSAEGHEYPDLQIGDEVNPRPFSMPLIIDNALGDF